tara:strand:- start:70 stop:234 length:165 start_codon:yes stop_codon:yes gene_type:complete
MISSQAMAEKLILAATGTKATGKRARRMDMGLIITWMELSYPDYGQKIFTRALK